jgi:tRNA G18 (ribose-2'-O)-methylase SpoU
MSTLFLLCKRSLSSGQKFSWKSLKVATNQQIKDLKSLSNHRSRDTADNLLLEGHRMIIDALKYQLEPKCIYISQNGIDSPLGMRLQQALCDLNWQTKLTSLNHDQLSKLSSVETSQGVLGIFRKPIITNTEVQTQLSHSSSPLILVCDRIRDPGNLGSIIRSGYGFGVDLLVNVETCDPWVAQPLYSFSHSLCP